jgi:hybrid cluster-associated redox disulfide protein
MAIQSHLLVDDVMRRWPATIPILIRHHMGCIGCPVGTFHTIEDACAAHKISLRDLLPKLQAAMV